MSNTTQAAVILPTAYLGSINYYAQLLKNSNCIIEQHEHYIKQTCRSRCEVYTPNGPKALSVPLVKRGKRQAVKDIKISYDYDWQKIHWRTLESSYRSSPFFEYYEDDFRPYFETKKHSFLIDLNEALQQEVLALLNANIHSAFSSEYIPHYENGNDLRNSTFESHSSEAENKRYTQVFETKHGFIPNLSIVDLLFNQGSRAKEFI